MENHGENRAPTFVYQQVHLLRHIKITGYLWTTLTVVNYHFQGKSQPYELSDKEKTNFDIDKTFRALKMIAWSFSTHHIEKRLNDDYTLPDK